MEFMEWRFPCEGRGARRAWLRPCGPVCCVYAHARVYTRVCFLWPHVLELCSAIFFHLPLLK